MAFKFGKKIKLLKVWIYGIGGIIFAVPIWGRKLLKDCGKRRSSLTLMGKKEERLRKESK